MAREYDIVVLGGGPGGYVAAIHAAQGGKSVAIVEQGKLGGTCLHRGCIPSKALLKSAAVFQTVKHAATYGVEVPESFLRFEAVQARKQEIIDGLESGIKHLMKKGKIDVFHGRGSILGPSIFSPMPGTISVEPEEGEGELILPRQLIIATGSRPRPLSGLSFDSEYVLSSDEALNMTELPKSITIIGGGVIGVEWASMLVDFGVDVTVVEYGDRLLPTEDKAVSKEVARQLKKRGVRVLTSAGAKSDSFKITETGVAIDVERNGELETLASDKLLVAIGRLANVEGIGLENTNVVVENGFIQVDDDFRTKENHMFAIGDVIGRLQLAHVASAEGAKAVEAIIHGTTTPLNYPFIPRCIYSVPEAASVGLTEDEAKAAGIDVKVGTFNFNGLGKARIEGEANGFIKLISDKATDDLLGVHIVGPKATELISEGGLALVLNATAWEVGQLVHPHPALAEAFGEAALAVDGLAIHA
ncbi:dihydrolipoyl dehydrogenase [Exiguobacterium flavidum]|uniref:dihydrolipoyl dehydrogenase n=1 Tax=Exiguobacterium flavidum TaxID=2184695 RepID=UPI000DF7F1A3|nr:dihydrolipoyl dehydrogenase [Exiguobacterium flavidum]